MKNSFWQDALKQAEEYRSACIGGMEKRDIFTPRILYNILALSVEKYCMSLFHYHHHMPECHTFFDLSRSLEEVIENKLNEEFIQNIKDLDKPQMAECSLEIFKPEPLGYHDIDVYLNTLEKVRSLVRSELEQTA